MSKRHSQAAKKLWSDPEMREHLGNLSKERWADPEWKEKTAKKAAANLKKRYDTDPELHACLSKKQQEIWSRPERRKIASEAAKRVLIPGSETCRKISEKAKIRCQDPEYRERMIKERKARWENPEYREKMKKIHKECHVKDPTLAEKKGAGSKKAWDSGKFSRRQSPWEPRYTKEWWEVRRQAFKVYGKVCCICGDSPKRLDVHHLVPYFLYKSNNIELLRVLCCSCHRKVERALCRIYAAEGEINEKLNQERVPDMPTLSQAGMEAMREIAEKTPLKVQRIEAKEEATSSNASTSALQVELFTT